MRFILKTPVAPSEDRAQDSQSESASFVPIFPVIPAKASSISSETTSDIQIVSLHVL